MIIAFFTFYLSFNFLFNLNFRFGFYILSFSLSPT